MFLTNLIITLVFVGCFDVTVCKIERQKREATNFEGTKIVDLNQFIGDWYMIAATPASGSNVNKCGHFDVKKISKNTFTMKYTAMSHKRNNPVVFNVNGTVGNDVIETWQLEGSRKIIGPISQVIIEANYDSYLSTLLRGEKSVNFPGHRIAMIWSRERRLPSFIVGKLKRKLGLYVNKKDILMVDHSNCQLS